MKILKCGKREITQPNVLKLYSITGKICIRYSVDIDKKISIFVCFYLWSLYITILKASVM